MRNFLTLFLIILIANGCSSNLEERHNQKRDLKEIEEHEVQQFQLSDFASNPKLEFSGLAWYKDKLILLPQYPDQIEKGNFLFLEKSEILNSIASNKLLSPKLLKVDLTGLEKFRNYGSGFESIAFKGDTVFASIEFAKSSGTTSVIAIGFIDSISLTIDFDENRLLQLPSNSGINNFSEEAIIVLNKSVIAIHEFNAGKNPKAFVIPFDLSRYEKIDFPQINYRITDATSINNHSKFYVINYFWEGDDSIFPIEDKISEKWGIGKTNKSSNNFERLLELEIVDNGIKLTENPPKYLKLPNKGRNWEGIVKLDKLGFLIITDKFPSSLLGFIKTEIEN